MFTQSIKNLTQSSAHITGGKGAALGELRAAGISVPDGFVVLSVAFDVFLNDAGLAQEIKTVLLSMNTDSLPSIMAASEKIQSLIKGAAMPDRIASEILAAFKALGVDFVAVRSSAIAEDGTGHAWAGQLESYLNSTERDVLEKVQSCWASFFTPRALLYRFENGFDVTDTAMSVVVQKMINAEKSGVAFSLHPVTQDRNQVVIEAGFGLGETIVSGMVTPDHYVVEKEPRIITTTVVHHQSHALYRNAEGGNTLVELGDAGKEQVLRTDEILQLSDLVCAIENHYGFPCDVEWAYEGGTVHVVQSRPVTTLSGSVAAHQKSIPAAPRLNEHIRLFEVSGMPFFINDTLSHTYRRLGALFFFCNGSWSSYLPVSALDITYKEAEELFASIDRFSAYKNDFEVYKQESWDFFEKTLGQESLTKEEATRFLSYLVDLHRLYIKTEFFYTDRAFAVKDDLVVARTLADIDYVKNSGREHLNKAFFGDASWISRFLDGIARQFSLDRKLASQLSHNEILALFDGQNIDIDILLSRERAYVSDHQNAIELHGAAAEDYIARMGSYQNSDAAILRGTVANGGFASGKARVFVYGYENWSTVREMVETMEQGEILVAETTSPELMLACKKASAILTNQGGMMSHAAIISRELHIPCIVGTQNATRLIKTGDEIEVHADNGEVRIKSRA